MRKTSLTFIMAAALAAAPAFAHGSMRPSHGGQVTMSGETLVELVRGPKGVSIFVSEEDEPIAAAGLTGKLDRKSTRLNSSHTVISYAVFCLKKKKSDINLQCRLILENKKNSK